MHWRRLEQSGKAVGKGKSKDRTAPGARTGARKRGPLKIPVGDPHMASRAADAQWREGRSHGEIPMADDDADIRRPDIAARPCQAAKVIHFGLMDTLFHHNYIIVLVRGDFAGR
jgi:hypothetical protein